MPDPITSATVGGSSAVPASKKTARGGRRTAARKPKPAVPPPTAPVASLRPAPAVVPVTATPRVPVRSIPPPADQPPKLLSAGHQGPDATMMYFLSLMLLLIIFFGTLVVVQQVLLIEAKSRLLAFARTAGSGTARLQVEVGQLQEQLESAQAELAQAQTAQPQAASVEDPDGAFRLTLPLDWFAVLDRAGTLTDLATPPADAVYRIALGPGRSPVIGGSPPIVVAKVAPAAAARYQRNFTNAAAEPLVLPNTDAAVKVAGVDGRRLVVIRVGETLYAIRYQLANNEDKTLEQIALAITFTPR